MIRGFLKKYKIEILAFFIPILIFLGACLFSGIVPFGDKYIVAYDGSAQYLGLTNTLINALKGKQSLLYSFKGGLGYNFYATAIYYLFNPTNLLSIFFNNTNIMYFYELIVLLRIGLCGLTMSIYLRNKEKENKGRLLFSIAYALMAYNIVYFYNFMYFDTVILFPLVILGLDKLIENKSPKTYIILLTLSIISNYYIGSMVCIFSLLYFIYKYILLEKSQRKGIIKKFIISSLFSGLMCSFILIPEFFELMRGKVELYQNEYTVYNEWSTDFITSFYRLTIASYSEGDQINGSPNIYSSILAFVYTVLFFFNTKYSKKERIATLIFICFFLLCFSYNFLDYAWQFFQRPCWYPNRYSFVFSFLLIITAYKAYNNTSFIKIDNKLLYLIIIVLLLIVTAGAFFDKIHTKDSIKYLFLALSSVCIIEYIFTYKIELFPYLLTAIFIFEVSANTMLGLKQISFPKKVGIYDDTFNSIKQGFDYIEKEDPIKNNFYRSDTNRWINLNNAGSFNYNGLIYFNSLRNGSLMNFLKNYANFKVIDDCSVRFNALNPVFTSLFGIKYIISDNKENFYDYIDIEKDKVLYNVYKNDEYLSLAFMVNSSIKNIELVDKSPYENANEIIKKTINLNDNLIQKHYYTNIYKYNEDNEYIYYDSKEGGYVSHNLPFDKDYFVFANPNHTSGNNVVCKNDEDCNQLSSFSPFVIYKDQKFEFKFYTNQEKVKKDQLYIYLMDINGFKSWINEIRKNELKIITYEKDNYIKGSINVSKDKTTLFTSIPYDDGWRVYVDGKKVKYDKLLTAFIGLDLEPGNHIIEFKYIPKGLIIGTIISFISLISSIFYVKNKKIIN